MTDIITSDSAFEAHMASWPDMPAWLSDMKRDAWKRFKELPSPERRLEAWRFAKTDDLALEAFPLVPPSSLPEGAQPSPSWNAPAASTSWTAFTAAGIRWMRIYCAVA
jgi:hypothetical protein